LFSDQDSDEHGTDNSFLFDRVSFEELSRFDEEDIYDEELDDEDFNTVARPPYMFQLTQEYYDITFFIMIIFMLFFEFFGLGLFGLAVY